MSLYAVKQNGKWVLFSVENLNEWKSLKKTIKISEVKKNIDRLIPGADKKNFMYRCKLPCVDLLHRF